jgi:RNA polymerase sigma-70 factor (ECF subfamily)
MTFGPARRDGESGGSDVSPLLDHLFRRSAGRLVSALTRVLGIDRLDLAEEVVQDALLKALQTWPFQGVPDNPEAWLYRVARNRALDVLRHEGRLGESVPVELLATLAPGARDAPSGDDELTMVFMCCHPSLSFDARVALTLRTAGGLSTDEIAAAFLTSRATVQQRIVRGKKRLAERGISLDLPEGSRLTERRSSVMAVMYLLFNEGYAATEGDALVRGELCGEAIRLARLLANHPLLGAPEMDALLALFLFQASRLTARSGDDGALILLEDQDRSLWDRTLIREGFLRLERATAADHPTRYHLEAGLAAAHAAAPRWEDTDWHRILDLYNLLDHVAGSPVVSLNRAVAVAMAHGPVAGLDALNRIEPDSLTGFYLLPATRGHLLALAGRTDEAAAALRRALPACRNSAVRAYLQRRIELCAAPPSVSPRASDDLPRH